MMKMLFGRGAAASVFVAVVASGCSRGPAGALLPPVPRQAICKVTGVQKSPWIVTLPAENSVDLDTRLSEGGLVAVRYRGCEMDVLTRCKIPGSYRWKSSSLASNALVIESADELYAKMPIGALSFEGHFARGEALRVAYTLSGRYSADRPTVGWDELKKLGDECATATHVVVGAIGGSYDFESVARSAVGGSAGGFVGGDSSARRAILTSRGKADACAKSSAADTAPPHNCGAPLKIELTEVACPALMHFEQEKGCVAGAGADGSGKSVIVNATPAEAPFVTLALESTRALYNAARGRPVPPEWVSDALAPTIPGVKEKMDRMGPSSPVASEIFIALGGKDASGVPLVINAGAILFPDGRLRWTGFVVMPWDLHKLGVIFRAIEPLKARFVKQLVGDTCAVDTLERADIESLPLSSPLRARWAGGLEEGAQRWTELCARLAHAKGPFVAGLIMLGMTVASDTTLALVSASVEATNNAPSLGALRFTLL